MRVRISPRVPDGSSGRLSPTRLRSVPRFFEPHSVARISPRVPSSENADHGGQLVWKASGVLSDSGSIPSFSATGRHRARRTPGFEHRWLGHPRSFDSTAFRLRKVIRAWSSSRPRKPVARTGSSSTLPPSATFTATFLETFNRSVHHATQAQIDPHSPITGQWLTGEQRAFNPTGGGSTPP